MEDKTVSIEENRAMIKNLTRHTLNLQLPGMGLSLLPGGTAEVFRPYLETAELKALLLQGAILEFKAEAGAKAKPEEDDAVKAVGKKPAEEKTKP